MYYPDGKRYEGNWRDGKKNGKGTYCFPNGASYRVVYADGKKKTTGTLMSAAVNLDELKNEYRSLAKKSMYARDFLKQNSHVKDVKKKDRLRDDGVIDILNPNRRGKGKDLPRDGKGRGNDKYGDAFKSPDNMNQDLRKLKEPAFDGADLSLDKW